MSIMDGRPGHPKKVLIALPAPLLDALDIRARAECRTRSELVREACRKYLGGDQPVAFAELSEETRKIMDASLADAEATAKKTRDDAERKRIDKLVSERLAVRLAMLDAALSEKPAEPTEPTPDLRDPITASLDLPAPRKVVS